VVFTGLRPGEKLREVLFGPGELDVRPTHPLIAQVAVPPLSPEMLVFLDDADEADSVVHALRALCDVWPMRSPATRA